MSKQIPALIKDCYDDLGYANVMHAIGEQGEKAGYKYTTGGELMPMAKFEKFLAYVGKRRKQKSLTAVFQMGSLMFEAVGGVVIDRELIKAMGEGLPLMALGQMIPPEVTELCKHCDSPLRYLPVCDCRWSKR